LSSTWLERSPKATAYGGGSLLSLCIADLCKRSISEDKDFTIQDKSTEELRRHLKIMLTGTFLREVIGLTSEELERIRHRNWDDISEVEETEEE
jgi:chemotaxis signal transduction protein